MKRGRHPLRFCYFNRRLPCWRNVHKWEDTHFVMDEVTYIAEHPRKKCVLIL